MIEPWWRRRRHIPAKAAHSLDARFFTAEKEVFLSESRFQFINPAGVFIVVGEERLFHPRG
jgi:hypothetical protein